MFADTNKIIEKTSESNDSEIQYGDLFGSMFLDEINESVECGHTNASHDYSVYQI